MTHELKYVRHSDLGFVLWARSDDLCHRHVGHLLARVPGTIISAGFCSLAGGVVCCWGESESLSIKSLPEDSRELAKQLGLSAQDAIERPDKQAKEILKQLGWTRIGQKWVEDKAATLTLAYRTLGDKWVGCGACDVDFKCHNGIRSCIRNDPAAQNKEQG